MGCKHIGTKVRGIGFWERAGLIDGHHTQFQVLRCECGGIFGFPSENYKLAKEKGLSGVKKQIADLESTQQGETKEI